MSLKLYADAACTTAVGASIAVAAFTDHSEGAQDFAFYLADVEADAGDTGLYEVVASSSPGVDAIVLIPADGNTGGGQQVSELKLATTALGLDSAVAGAALSLGSTITAGVSGAVQLHARFENTRSVVGVASDLSIGHNAIEVRAKP